MSPEKFVVLLVDSPTPLHIYELSKFLKQAYKIRKEKWLRG